MKKKKANKITWREDEDIDKIRHRISNLNEMISNMVSRTFIELADIRGELAKVNYELFKIATEKEQ